MENCIFCRIANKELPSWIVYETELVMVILAKETEVYGHTLVTTKHHYKDITDIPKDTLSEIMEVAKKIITHYRDKIGSSGANIIGSTGMGAQQSVPHFHFHILPRFENDGLDARPKFPEIDVDKDAFLKKVQF